MSCELRVIVVCFGRGLLRRSKRAGDIEGHKGIERDVKGGYNTCGGRPDDR